MRYDEEYEKGLMPPTPGELVTIVGDPVSKEKIQLMQDYAKKLFKNSPKMKPERLKRKVAEHFNVKLV